MLTHHRDCGAHRAELPPQIYPKNVVKLSFGHLPDGFRWRHDASVANESIKAAKAIDCRPHHALAASIRRHVVVDGDGLAAALADLSDHVISRGPRWSPTTFTIATEIGDDNSGAFASKLEGEFPSDTSATSRDGDTFTFETVSHGGWIPCFKLCDAGQIILVA